MKRLKYINLCQFFLSYKYDFKILIFFCILHLQLYYLKKSLCLFSASIILIKEVINLKHTYHSKYTFNHTL